MSTATTSIPIRARASCRASRARSWRRFAGSTDMRWLRQIMRTIPVAVVAATACTSGSSSPRHTSETSGSGTIQSLGLPHAANATPVLAASGPWVVAVWTATERDRTNVYVATSNDAAIRFGSPDRVNDVDGEAHVYGEDPRVWR